MLLAAGVLDPLTALTLQLLPKWTRSHVWECCVCGDGGQSRILV